MDFLKSDIGIYCILGGMLILYVIFIYKFLNHLHKYKRFRRYGVDNDRDIALINDIYSLNATNYVHECSEMGVSVYSVVYEDNKYYIVSHRSGDIGIYDTHLNCLHYGIGSEIKKMECIFINYLDTINNFV